MMKMDGLDECCLGRASRINMEPLLVYSYEKLLEHFMAEGMSHEEAVEWIGFNVAGAWIGEGTPLILHELEEGEL
jgi:hypothetical protein